MFGAMHLIYNITPEINSHGSRLTYLNLKHGDCQFADNTAYCLKN